MLIEVESLKELEVGKTYVLQTSKKLIKQVSKATAAIAKKFGFRILVCDEETHFIDAPKPQENRKVKQ